MYIALHREPGKGSAVSSVLSKVTYTQPSLQVCTSHYVNIESATLVENEIIYFGETKFEPRNLPVEKYDRYQV